jgi:hypothetical protein
MEREEREERAQQRYIASLEQRLHQLQVQLNPSERKHSSSWYERRKAKKQAP